jgi:hypothetical protein
MSDQKARVVDVCGWLIVSADSSEEKVHLQQQQQRRKEAICISYC